MRNSRLLSIVVKSQCRRVFVRKPLDTSLAFVTRFPYQRKGQAIRRILPLFSFLAALASGSGAVLTDELDGWCAQAKKASSIVICSDAELRQQAMARNKLFEQAREKLSPDAYKALTQDQSQWIKSYTATCGVSIDGPVPSLPVPQSVIDCYRRESLARTAQLAERLSEPTTAAPPQAPSIKSIVIDALVRAGIPRPKVEALAAWNECTEDAVDKFADQPESAHTVAEAAVAPARQKNTNTCWRPAITPPIRTPWNKLRCRSFWRA
jgi:uncharacterized protein YecT (DUF1311 family)